MVMPSGTRRRSRRGGFRPPPRADRVNGRTVITRYDETPSELIGVENPAVATQRSQTILEQNRRAESFNRQLAQAQVGDDRLYDQLSADGGFTPDEINTLLSARVSSLRAIREEYPEYADNLDPEINRVETERFRLTAPFPTAARGGQSAQRLQLPALLSEIRQREGQLENQLLRERAPYLFRDGEGPLTPEQYRASRHIVTGALDDALHADRNPAHHESLQEIQRLYDRYDAQRRQTDPQAQARYFEYVYGIGQGEQERVNQRLAELEQTGLGQRLQELAAAGPNDQGRLLQQFYQQEGGQEYARLLQRQRQIDDTLAEIERGGGAQTNLALSFLPVGGTAQRFQFAQHPDSPGGSAITPEERLEVNRAVTADAAFFPLQVATFVGLPGAGAGAAQTVRALGGQIGRRAVVRNIPRTTGRTALEEGGEQAYELGVETAVYGSPDFGQAAQESAIFIPAETFTELTSGGRRRRGVEIQGDITTPTPAAEPTIQDVEPILGGRPEPGTFSFGGVNPSVNPPATVLRDPNNPGQVVVDAEGRPQFIYAPRGQGPGDVQEVTPDIPAQLRPQRPGRAAPYETQFAPEFATPDANVALLQSAEADANLRAAQARLREQRLQSRERPEFRFRRAVAPALIGGIALAGSFGFNPASASGPTTAPTPIVQQVAGGPAFAAAPQQQAAAETAVQDIDLAETAAQETAAAPTAEAEVNPFEQARDYQGLASVEQEAQESAVASPEVQQAIQNAVDAQVQAQQAAQAEVQAQQQAQTETQTQAQAQVQTQQQAQTETQVQQEVQQQIQQQVQQQIQTQAQTQVQQQAQVQTQVQRQDGSGGMGEGATPAGAAVGYPSRVGWVGTNYYSLDLATGQYQVVPLTSQALDSAQVAGFSPNPLQGQHTAGSLEVQVNGRTVTTDQGVRSYPLEGGGTITVIPGGPAAAPAAETPAAEAEPAYQPRIGRRDREDDLYEAGDDYSPMPAWRRGGRRAMQDFGGDYYDEEEDEDRRKEITLVFG